MKNGAKGIVAILLAGVLAAGVCCTGYASRGDDGKWFKNGDLKTWHWKDKDKEPDVPTPPTGGDEEETGGLVVGESEGNGVEVCSAILPRAAYAANGVSEQAESAYVLTATVGSDNYGENTGVNWSVEWKNPDSEWATGKTVTDYVTVTPSGNGYMESKTATLACLAPFGEEIFVIASLRENPDIYTTCILDYLQRVTDFNLSFGTVECDFENGSAEENVGFTYVTVEANNGGTPAGGVPNFQPVTTADYTAPAEIEWGCALSVPNWIHEPVDEDDERYYLDVNWLSASGNYGEFYQVRFYDFDKSLTVGSQEWYRSCSYKTFKDYAQTGLIKEKGIVFSIPFFVENMGLTCSTGGMGASPISGEVFDANTMCALHNRTFPESKNMTYQGDTMFTLSVKVRVSYKGERKNEIIKTTNFKSESMTNNAKLTSVDLDKSEIIM